MIFYKKQQGFTLVELMVVVAIIIIMSAITLAAIVTARSNTREKKRVSDLANIEYAVVLARERDGDYPQYDAGAEIGIGGAIDTTIIGLGGNIYRDPLNQDNVYEYWYDSDFTCTHTNQVVVYARTMEQTKNGNFSTLCTHSSAAGQGATASSFVKIIDGGMAN